MRVVLKHGEGLQAEFGRALVEKGLLERVQVGVIPWLRVRDDEGNEFVNTAEQLRDLLTRTLAYQNGALLVNENYEMFAHQELFRQNPWGRYPITLTGLLRAAADQIGVQVSTQGRQEYTPEKPKQGRRAARTVPVTVG